MARQVHSKNQPFKNEEPSSIKPFFADDEEKFKNSWKPLLPKMLPCVRLSNVDKTWSHTYILAALCLLDPSKEKPYIKTIVNSNRDRTGLVYAVYNNWEDASAIVYQINLRQKLVASTAVGLIECEPDAEFTWICPDFFAYLKKTHDIKPRETNKNWE